MLKVRRCHLAALGNRNARFSPVGLDFRAGDAAANSVIFLENGGGKTTLAAFLYLTLWPEQAHFLLKKAKDSQTRVADYLMPGQSAFCALECETRIAGLQDQPIIRVIGQAIQRRDTTDRSPVQRHFFTFLPCPGLSFDDLPIHGINGQRASLSLDEFRTWLKEQRSKAPGAELWEGSSVEEYLQKLRDVHAEPELVRVQIDLNKREGGIDDHFKEHCADSKKFVHTFLDLALQSAKSEETAAVLGTFLAEWLNIGHLEDEILFCEEFSSALANLSDAQAKWKKSDEALQQCRCHAAGFWLALDHKREEMSQLRQETETLLATIKLQAIEAKRDLDNSYHHVISYELEWLELSASEASLAAENAEREWQQARRSNHLAKLAVSLGDIERHRRDLEAKRKVFQEKQAELAPQLQTLHRFGAAFANSLDLLIAKIAGDVELLLANQGIRKDQQQDLERKHRNLAVGRNDCERTIGEVRTFVERRRYQRDQLAERGWLQPNERAEEGQVRWSTEQVTEEANVVEQRAHIQRLDQRLSELSARHTLVERQSVTAENEVTLVQSRLDSAARDKADIIGNDFVLSHFGESFDPLRHGAREDLLQKQADVFRLLLNLQLDLALLERSREGIEKHQVLPPARDIELVLHRLQEADIEAAPALRYLAETCNCDEAERLIRSDPGKYAGVLVRPNGWERVATLAWPEVAQPIEVSLFPESMDGQNDLHHQVVVPARPAFDKVEASRRSLRLDDEVSSARRQLDAKRAEYDGLGHVVTLLTSFVRLYGEGRLGALEREVGEKRRHSEALRSRCLEVQSEIQDVQRARLTSRDAEIASLERIKRYINPAVDRIHSFIAEFEEKVAGMRDRDQIARDRLIEIETEETETQKRRQECEAALATIQADIFNLQLQLRQLRDEVAGIHYREGIVGQDLAGQPLETLRASYSQQRLFYEGQQDSEAQIQLATAERVLQSKQADFSQQLESANETEVRARAESFGYVEATLREEAAIATQKLEQTLHFRAHKDAERDRTRKDYTEKKQTAPEGGKRRFPEGEERPTTSAEAHALLKKGQATHEQRSVRKQALDEEGRSLADRSSELEKRALEYAGQGNLLEEFQHKEPLHVELPRDFAEIKAAVSSVKAQEKSAADDESRERRERTDRMRTARLLTTAPRFSEKKVGLAKKFELYPEEDLLTDVDQLRGDLGERIAAHRDRLAGLKQTREQLVHMMDGLADEILVLLRSIEKVSRLPEDGMGAWSGKPFIRVSFHQPDASERQLALRQLLEELIEVRRNKSNQAPDTDASGLLRIIADRTVCDKRIRVQILKPTPIRTDTYEDVELLRHYSGGEGVTVAILMYLTIVQLRAQSVQNSKRLQDAGFLLLDNPFGKCNRPDLVQMHVQLAEQLRVQLIVLTGLREPVIMMSYPRRVRLVNDLLNRVTGAKHVRVSDSEGQITSVDNLRRFSLPKV
jgi:hypothetical protein